MFLSGKWIAEQGVNLFTPFCKKNVDCSAYTMKIGSEAFISPRSKSKNSPLIEMHQGEPISIHSGQFAFLITREIVSIPYNLFALINIKNGLKVQGLINVSGFHVDPGYNGKLIFAVFNSGPKTIILREGDDAFLIWIARLEDPSREYSRSKGGFSKITSNLAANIPHESISLSALNEKVDALNFKFGIAIAIATAVFGGAVALIANLSIKKLGG